jgi:hypothetical protein
MRLVGNVAQMGRRGMRMDDGEARRKVTTRETKM